jgi:hypothetical protein
MTHTRVAAFENENWFQLYFCSFVKLCMLLNKIFVKLGNAHTNLYVNENCIITCLQLSKSRSQFRNAHTKQGTPSWGHCLANRKTTYAKIWYRCWTFWWLTERIETSWQNFVICYRWTFRWFTDRWTFLCCYGPHIINDSHCYRCIICKEVEVYES